MISHINFTNQGDWQVFYKCICPAGLSTSSSYANKCFNLFSKYFLYNKCNYTKICTNPEFLRITSTTLIINAFNFTTCDIPCSRRQQKEGQQSLRRCCLQVVHMQRVCPESEKTEAYFSPGVVKCTVF